MKTPEQILEQECDWLQIDVIYVKSIEKAMKEYAKQWVGEALNGVGLPLDELQERIINQIDNQ